MITAPAISHILHSDRFKKPVLITVFNFYLPEYAGDPLMAAALPYWIQCNLIHASRTEKPIILVPGSTDRIGKTTGTAPDNWEADVILRRGNEKNGALLKP
jgi:hypothetical protein